MNMQFRFFSQRAGGRTHGLEKWAVMREKQAFAEKQAQEKTLHQRLRLMEG
jgi:hypothetical protein